MARKIWIARRLLQKAIDLDSNLWKCKNLIATSYAIVGNNKTGLKVWKNNLEEAKSIDNKEWIAGTLSNIGHQYMLRGDFDKAMDYQKKSIKTFNELNFIPKRGLGWPLKFIGQIYQLKGDYDKSIEFHNKQLEANKNVNNLYGIASAYNYLGCVHALTGNYNDALNYLFRSIETLQKRHLHRSYIRYAWIASIYSILGDYNNAIKYSGKSIKNNLNEYVPRSSSFTRAIIHQSLSYKKLGKKYNEKEIIKLVKRDKKIDYDNNYYLYQLLEDTSYLETAYNQVQEQADNLEPDVKAKFLSYPIPKAIVEEWEKVTTDKN